MKKESMRKYTLLGLVLIGASAVTAAMLPKNDVKKAGTNGVLEPTNGGDGLTCSDNAVGGDLCTYTATQGGAGEANDGQGSRTSTAAATSSITNAAHNPQVTITSNGVHTSQDA